MWAQQIVHGQPSSCVLGTVECYSREDLATGEKLHTYIIIMCYLSQLYL